MSRIRTIKPEFWTNAQVVECSTNARLLFIGLWNFSDDYGRHVFSPKQIKAEIFPCDDFSIEAVRIMLGELSKNNLIVVYVVENKEILQITGWHNQRIDKPQKPKFPGPLDDNSENVRRELPPEGKGMEKKGIESKKLKPSVLSKKTEPRKKNKSEIAKDTEPTPKDELFASDAGMSLPTITTEWAQFRDHHLKNRSMFADWPAAWRMWVRNAAKWHPNGNGATTPQKAQPPPKMAGQNRLRTSKGLWVDNEFYPD
jgi:hypothetical protein